MDSTRLVGILLAQHGACGARVADQRRSLLVVLPEESVGMPYLRHVRPARGIFVLVSSARASDSALRSRQFQPDPFDTKGRFSGTGSFGTENPDAETDGNYRWSLHRFVGVRLWQIQAVCISCRSKGVRALHVCNAVVLSTWRRFDKLAWHCLGVHGPITWC